MMNLKSQLIKLKHTMIIPILFIVPIVLVSLFGFLAFYSQQMEYSVFRVTSLQLFLQLGFPLTMTVVIGLCFRMERRNKAFQNTIIYFKNFWTYYISQFIFYVFLGWLMITIGYLLQTIYYAVLVHQESMWSLNWIAVYVELLIVVLPMISFIYMINYLFQGFVLPSLVSLVLIFGGLFVGVLGTIVSYFYFYAYPIFTLYNGYDKWILMILSIILTALFLWIGYKILLKHMERGKL
ncbi:ABC transporter permease [Staphylococcus canis]|uniref:ABC transporter permease subunit n=1 Tax=Staphylococcus canis TaxID=2724942 RepID=A0ABS0T8I1_9STAP|nr:ABC transporter permease [Staphylococcus canis]MBI5975068.1 ABC transporter permease subunit [Staphylococcus canis]